MTPSTPRRGLTIRSAAIPQVNGAPLLEPLKLEGEEGINQLFEYRLVLHSPEGAAPLELDSFIGRELTCCIELDGHGSFVPGVPGGAAANQGAGVREISGLITQARYIGESGRHALVEFTLRPWLHLATLTTDCKVFQDQSVVDIIEAVLGEYPFAADKRLIERYPRRDYTVQYNESDFEFVSRLMQEWGINHHFEHSAGVHRLIWSDHNGAFGPSACSSYHRIPYHPLGHKIDREYIHGFSPVQRLTSGRYASRDIDYTRPGASLEVNAEGARDTGHATQEVYLWRGDKAAAHGQAGVAGSDHSQPNAGADKHAHQTEAQGQHLARLRMQALRQGGHRARGTGHVRGIVPGCSFHLTGHPHPNANTEYLVLQTHLLIESHMRGSTGNSLGAAQWVRIEYAGHATLTSHTLTGKPIGQPVVEVEGEYRLHLEAQARHDSLSPGDKAKSSPSGWYELLRFGRNLGRGEAAADKDPLPNNAAHWRKINTPAGEQWVDLNATGTFKLSDADFPNCAGWTCIADDTSTEDQRCDSVRLKALITSDITDMAIKAATFKNPAQLFAASNKPAIMKKLRRAICKFPSEFDQGTFERRYGHIREETYFQENPGSWEKLKAHIQAMTCTDLPAAYKNAQWHFHPLEFIEHMRKCMWLSKQELVQLVPSHAVRTGQWKDTQGNRQAGVFWEMVRRPDTESDESIIAKHRIPLNRTMRKYGINTSLRQASFLSNAIQESGWLARLQELGGDGYWYTPWHGRGLLQLTHPGNYFAYWEWRGRSIPLPLKQVMQKAAETEAKKAPDLRSKAAMQDAHFPGLTPEILKWRSDVDGAAGTQREPTGDALVAPSDSAGHYAAVKGLVRQADGANEVERRSVSIVDAKGQSQGERVYYRSQAFWKVSASINLPAAVHREDYRGINGFDSRGSAYGVALAVLTEIRLPDVKGNKLIEYPEGYAPRRSAP